MVRFFPSLPSIGRNKITVAFDGGLISSDSLRAQHRGSHSPEFMVLHLAKCPSISVLVRSAGPGVAEQIVGAICERLERATMVALDSIVFFPAPI